MADFHNSHYIALTAVRASASDDDELLRDLTDRLVEMDTQQLCNLVAVLAAMTAAVVKEFHPAGIDDYLEVNERLTLTDDVNGEPTP